MRTRLHNVLLAFAVGTFGGGLSVASAQSQRDDTGTAPAQRTAAWTGVVDVRLPGDPASMPARVAVHIPAGLNTREPFHVVAWFHGAGDCAARFVWEGVVDGRHCGRRDPQYGHGGSSLHDLAGTRSILIAPQLHSGRDTGLKRPDGFRRLLTTLLEGEVGAHLGGARTLDDVSGIVMGAHSLGARTVDRVMEVGGVSDKVTALLYYDGVMGSHAPHVRWLEASPTRRLGSVTGEVTRAVRHGRALTAAWNEHHPSEPVATQEPFDQALRTRRVAVVHSPLDHGVIHREYFVAGLRALNLPSRPR